MFSRKTPELEEIVLIAQENAIVTCVDFAYKFAEKLTDPGMQEGALALADSLRMLLRPQR